MTAELDPRIWLNFPELIELAQGCKSILPEVVPSDDGQTTEAASSTDRSKFMRLSTEPFPDLDCPQALENLRNLCVAAHRSEEFFLTDDAKQWLRTAVKSKQAYEPRLFSRSLTEEGSRRIVSDIIIHSNALPCEPFWPKPPAVRDEAVRLASMSVHFPCCILEEALAQNETLFQKLHQWQGECEIGTHAQGRPENGNTEVHQSPSKLFFDIIPDEVSRGKRLTPDDGAAAVWSVTWRGGQFIAKDHETPEALETELKVVGELCHPHVVYIFGRDRDEHGLSIYMEHMQNDLHSVLVDKYTQENRPPFSHQESIDILWQVAKAMTHMHEKKVIHGDLKTHNILISPFDISENQRYYLAKVADFGSSKVYNDEEDAEPFVPGNPTLEYAAPEVLLSKLRKGEGVVISDPTKIDVFSFGIIGFEVLIGEKVYKQQLAEMTRANLKEKVIKGTLRPPLHTECQTSEKNYLKDERVIKLIESCWDKTPSNRPSFSDIVKMLGTIRTEISEATFRSIVQRPPQAVNGDLDGQVSGNSEIIPLGQTTANISNGHLSPTLVQATTSVAPCNKRRKQRRATKSLRKFLCLISCVSGGKVKDDL